MSKRYAIKVIPIEEAIGKRLAHDITEIRPGEFKGVAFKRGHRIRKSDIPHLLRLGKESIYVLDLSEGMLHEDEAALLLGEAFKGEGTYIDGPPSEGKVQLRASYKGLFKVDVKLLTKINMINDIICSSRHTNTLVEKGDLIAATRAIPLIIDEKKVLKAVDIAQKDGGIFKVKRLLKPKTGIIITGNEILYGRIRDRFSSILKRKLKQYDLEIIKVFYSLDDKFKIADYMHELLNMGVEMILVAGGMSVDPDDQSRAGILFAGTKEVVYGSPVLPGAMFLYGKIKDVPVLGLPACVIYFKATIFDLVLPRVLAGESITRKDLASLSHGGLCLNCKRCNWPICPFGK